MGDTEDIQVRQDMTDPEYIHLSFAGENQNEEQERTASEAGHKNDQEDTQNNCMKRLRSSWHAILIGVLMMLLCVVTSNLFIQMHKQQSLTAELQHMAEELQIKNSHLKQLLNSTHQNSSECGHMTLLIDAMLYNFTLLSAEKTKLSLLLKNISQEKNELSLLLENTSQEKRQLEAKNKDLSVSLNSALNNFTLLSAEKTELSLLLKNTLHEKTQVEEEKKELAMFLHSTIENCNHVEAESRQLHLHLNASRRIISLVSAESERWCQLLDIEWQTTTQLEELNKRQHSILFSSKLSFLWRFCDRNTLQRSHCLPGWVEPASHCFFRSKDSKTWEKARRESLDMGADMAVVLNAEDQAFLTNMTFQFVQQHPEEGFHSAWIGLQDMAMESDYFWVTGQRIHPDVTYWRSRESNNAMASWDNSQAGQDCVAIVPPTSTEKQGWVNSWDEVEVDNKELTTSLNSALNNFTLLSAEKTKLGLLLKNTSQEKNELSLLLENTSQEKTQLEEENRELNMFLNSTMNNFSLLSAEKTELNLLLENTSKEKKELNLLLENTLQEKRKLEVENKDLSTSLNSALNNFTSLSAEKTELSLLLKNTLHEKTQVEEEKKELAMFLHSTMENCNHVEAESRQLHLHLNASRCIISLASAESERWRQLLDIERQTTMQLEELNKRQHSILFSSKLSFLWRFCDRNTLQRSHCLPGWVKHASHCFFLSKDSKKWEKARRESLGMGADMAVVLNAEDQAFLTNMTFQFVQQHPEEAFHSAWIRLQDMAMESDYFWVTGIHPDVTYWRSRESNNAMASWDNSQAGQDCVAIVPPTSTEKQGWVNSWDDIICAGERHYLCETTALSVT